MTNSDWANGEFDGRIVTDVAHRPWTMPGRPWVMTQTWHDLLFAHWPVDVSRLRSKVPAAFEIDLFNGEAWIGVVPFRMSNVGPRGIPSFPGVSAFPELNVRTYVRTGDRPGVYFFSLDAGSTVAVQSARLLLNLPYYVASMTVERVRGAIQYHSVRHGDSNAEFDGTYEPIGPVSLAAAGSLEYFLTERYCLYHVDRRGIPYRLEIHHPPWKLQPATATLTRNTMAEASGLSLPEQPPLLHFVQRQDTIAWTPSNL